MNNLFDIKRFKHLFADHLNNNRISYLLMLCTMLGLFVLSVVIHLFWREDIGYKLPVLGGILVIILVPFFFHLQKTDMEYMLPASLFEKFLIYWISYLIIIPFLITFVIIVCVKAGNIMFSNYSEVSGNICNQVEILNLWLRFVGIQSIVILGQTLFKKQIFFKTALMGILFFILLIIGLKITAYLTGEEVIDVNRMSVLSVTLKFLFIVGMWAISYFRLKKIQL